MVTMNTKGIPTPRFGKLECAFSLLTALILLSVLGALTSDLFSFAAAKQAASNGVPEVVSMNRHEMRRVSQGPSNGVRFDARSAPLRATTVEKARPVGAMKLERITTDGEAQEPPTPSGGPAFTRQASPPGFGAEPTLLQFIGKTVLTVVIILVVAIVGSVVFVVCLVGLLRRVGPHLGPLIRIEYNGPPMAVGPLGASSFGVAAPLPQAIALAPERQDRTADGQVRITGVDTAKPYDLGPTFEAQRRGQEEQATRLGEAVLQHLFEENLDLHAKIGLTKEKGQEAPLADKG